MCSILGRLYRQGLGLGQLPTENFRQVAGTDDRDRLQCREPVVRCLTIADSRFLNDRRGTNQFEARPRVSPPVPCGELVDQDTDIVSQPARQLAHLRRLHADSKLDPTVTRSLLRCGFWGLVKHSTNHPSRSSTVQGKPPSTSTVHMLPPSTDTPSSPVSVS